MKTAQIEAILRQDHLAGADVGRSIQCRGCGEMGRAAWARTVADSFTPAPVTRLSGNFFVHNGHIACGRCQQIYRAD